MEAISASRVSISSMPAAQPQRNAAQSIPVWAKTPLKQLPRPDIGPLSAWTRVSNEPSARGVFLRYIASLDHAADDALQSGAEASPSSTAARAAFELLSDPRRVIDRKALERAHARLMRQPRSALRSRGRCVVLDRASGVVRYEPPGAEQLPRLLARWFSELPQAESSPALAYAAVLRLLLIHPFADGNGRLARVLLAALCWRAGCPDPCLLLALRMLYAHGGQRWQAASARVELQGDWPGFFAEVSAALAVARANARAAFNASDLDSASGQILVQADALWQRAGGGFAISADTATGHELSTGHTAGRKPINEERLG